MTISLSGFTFVPYVGNSQTIVNHAINRCAPNTSKPAVVSLKIDWSQYAANVGIVINLQGQSVANPLDYIKGIFIDNTDCNNVVVAQFPDTAFPVVCQANSSQSSPALTNNLIVQVFNLGSQNAGVTTVFLTNSELPLNQSPEFFLTVMAGLITSGGNVPSKQTYSPYALGEVGVETLIDLTVAGSTQLLQAQVSGIYVITAIELRLDQCFAMVPTFWNANIFGLQPLSNYEAMILPSITTPAYTGLNLTSRTGMQLQIDATSALFFNNNQVLVTGRARVELNFTWVEIPATF